MQYFKPEGDFFVGDPMPFYHDGVFHLFYLIDENHHRGKGGLGGHYWAHASTVDLVNWTHHPVAIPLGAEGSYDQNTICTGSVFFHDGVFYAPYATRILDENGVSGEHLCMATSTDCIHFTKDPQNPIASPPKGYDAKDFRDPVIFRDENDGLFHMLITAHLSDAPVYRRGGCVAQMVSEDLKSWRFAEPFALPRLDAAPECADYFYWNGRYYLTVLSGLHARVRCSAQPYGPFVSVGADSFDGLSTVAQKSAPYKDDRRLAASFLFSKEDDSDDGAYQYGGNLVFRELVPNPDGSIGSKFPPEMTPSEDAFRRCALRPVMGRVQAAGEGLRLESLDGFAAAACEVAPDAFLRMTIAPKTALGNLGLYLRASDNASEGYHLKISPWSQTVRLQKISFSTARPPVGNEIQGVTGLDRRFSLEIAMKGSVIDVCVDGRRTLIDRFPELRGGHLFFYTENSTADIENLRVAEY